MRETWHGRSLRRSVLVLINNGMIYLGYLRFHSWFIDVSIRWYTESSYPTAIAHHLYKLGQTHGFEKITNTLLSMSLPPPVLAVMQGYLHYGKTFKVEGYDF